MIFAGGFDSGVSIALTIIVLIGSLLTVIYALRFFGNIFFGDRKPESLPQKAPRALILPTLVITIFLIVEGLTPGPLLTWAMKGLASFIGGLH